MTQTVFISGATSGIGLVTARMLLEKGWHVYAAGLPQDDFSLLEHERVTTLPLDITDAQAVSAAVATIQRQSGSLNALVNNAGIQLPGALEALPMDAMRRQFEVNVFGHLQVTREMLPLLRAANGARIVTVTSLMGKVAMPILGAYSMTKHALEAMSDALRLELAPQKIHVAVIEPGAIQTPMTGSMGKLMERAQSALSADLHALYDPLYEAMSSALVTQEKHATAPETVAKAILHALSAKKPRSRYAIGGAVKGLILMRNLAPEEIGDRILQRALGLD
jgi:NAD(P)-dependent dehydrogenase (short-subunit alcohol dehydrogenase family)